MQLIFATNNKNKITEIRSALSGDLNIITLQEAGIDIDIPEPHHSLEENAREKSTVINKLTGQNCFSEDTGLEVNVLNGEPGVRSARYAGDEADNKKNIALLLQKLTGKTDRAAQFKTVISLILNDEEHQFTGICKGEIITAPKGDKGFGYDPVFVPEGSKKTFAEMDLEEKNRFSHRKKAFNKLLLFLNQHYGKN